MTKGKMIKGQTTIYKTLHRKPNIEFTTRTPQKQVMLIIVDVTVAMTCRTVINVMLFYLKTIVS